MTNEKVLSRIGWDMTPEKKENVFLRFLPLWVGVLINLTVTGIFFVMSVKSLEWQLNNQGQEITALQTSVKEINDISMQRMSSRWTAQDHKYYAEYIERELKTMRENTPPEWLKADIIEMKTRIRDLEYKKKK